MADIGVDVTAIVVEVVEAQGLSVDEPRVLVEHGGIINITGGGGDGTGDVVGPNGVEAGRPARFADSSGKVIEAAPINSPGGLVVLDGDGTIPDNRIPASIARDSEVTSAISAATADMVIDTDPRLSDARTPLAHTHPATAVSTVPATTGLDPASTDVEAALTELAARPSGGGGFGSVPNRSGFTYAPPVATLSTWSASSL